MDQVVVKHISKSYRNGKSAVRALDDISFNVGEGELFGLIGPDGAGKTTLFRLLTTLLVADSGEATVTGLDVVKDFQEIRKRIGYMPGKFSLYPDLTVEENLSFFATLFDTSIEENYDLVKDIYVQIEKFRTRKAGALSGGMKQKLALSCALIHRPKVLFLDEPTTGVDAVSRKEFWDLLRKLQEQKITILVSTPYMDEASLCDRVALVQEGRILDIDTPDGITKRFGHQLFSFRHSELYRLLVALQKSDFVASCFPFGQELHVVLQDPGSMQTLIQQLKDDGFQGVEIQSIAAGIEDCFMQLMNNRSPESTQPVKN